MISLNKSFSGWVVFVVHLLCAFILFYLPHTNLVSADLNCGHSLSDGFITTIRERLSFNLFMIYLTFGYLSVFILPMMQLVSILKVRYILVHIVCLLIWILGFVHFYFFRMTYTALASLFPHRYERTYIFVLIFAALFYSLLLIARQLYLSFKKVRNIGQSR